MRNQAAPLLAGTLLLAKPTYALGGVSSIDFGFISTLLNKALGQLTQILAIQSVRVVIALIAIFIIFYNLLDSILGKINQLSESRKPIAIAISLLAVLAIFKTLKIETLDKLMISFGILMVVIILFKIFMKLKNFLGQKFNPRKAQKEQKQLKSNEKESRKFDDEIQKDMHEVTTEVNNEHAEIINIENELKRILNESEDGKKLIKKIYGDTHK